jgi:hypothetical protein
VMLEDEQAAPPLHGARGRAQLPVALGVGASRRRATAGGSCVAGRGRGAEASRVQAVHSVAAQALLAGRLLERYFDRL